MKRISNFSAYARPEAHLTRQTLHGAVVTVLGVTLALFLFTSELAHFWKLNRVTKMGVDVERRRDLPINLDITFPSIPCAVLSIDALDVAGTSENDASFAKGMSIHKVRLDAQGNRIGKGEYHTPQSQQVMGGDMGGATMMNVNVPQALKHLADMEAEAETHEGCHISGTMIVHRVAGRLHISVHQMLLFQMLPQLLGGHHVPHLLNISHHIHSLSFGPHYPGQVNPLDDYKRILTGPMQVFKYFLKVVPTEYYGRLGGVTETQQYSVSEYATPLDVKMGQPPSIDFMYDMSPIVVTVNDSPPAILHFVVRLCAVVGGVFAVTRLADRWVNWLLHDILRVA